MRFSAWLARDHCSTITVALALTAFVIGLAPASALRQPAPCDPIGNGCPISFDEPVSAAIVDPAEAHLWWLTVRTEGSFRLELTDLPADYRLYAYAPDGTLLGQSDNPGSSDEVLEVPAARTGSYAIFIDSPTGEASAAAYELLARWTAAVPIREPTTAPALPPVASRPTATLVPFIPPPPTDAAVEPALVAPSPTRGAEASPSAPAFRPTTGPVPPTPTRPPGVPSTCTTPALTLDRPAIRSDEAMGWQAQGFKPGTSVRAQAFANGAEPASEVTVSAVDSDCTANDEAVVRPVPRAGYYVLHVTGSRYGTDRQLNLVARFNVSTSPR